MNRTQTTDFAIIPVYGLDSKFLLKIHLELIQSWHGAWESELVKMATEIGKGYAGDKRHKEAERVCHLQIAAL